MGNGKSQSVSQSLKWSPALPKGLSLRVMTRGEAATPSKPTYLLPCTLNYSAYRRPSRIRVTSHVITFFPYLAVALIEFLHVVFRSFAAPFVERPRRGAGHPPGSKFLVFVFVLLINSRVSSLHSSPRASRIGRI